MTATSIQFPLTCLLTCQMSNLLAISKINAPKDKKSWLTENILVFKGISREHTLGGCQ